MITVTKLDHTGREIFSYQGRALARGATWVQLEAIFRLGPVTVGDVVFRQGDRFVEWYFSDRWYTIYEVHDAEDDHLKGWYCDIARPAVLAADAVRFEDLALDLWVGADGRLLVMDEEEFDALPLDEAERQAARAALEALRRAVGGRTPPFDALA